MSIIDRFLAYERECQRHWDENAKIGHKRKEEETRLANERWMVENQRLEREISLSITKIYVALNKYFPKIFPISF